MAAKYWLKLYHEILDDAKVMTLRPALRWRFIETLLVAGELDQDGILPDVTHYAWRVRSDFEQTESDLAELADKGLLSRNSGQYFVTKFAERQAPVTDAERMRRYRDRQRLQPSDDNVTDGVTYRNTDTDTDKIRIDKTTKPDKIRLSTHYQHPDPEEIVNLKTALSQVVRESWEYHEEAYDKAAYTLMGWDVTPELLSDFGSYWEAKGWHKDIPVIKNVIDSWKSFLEWRNNKNKPAIPKEYEGIIKR